MPIEHVWGLVLVLAGVAILAVLDDIRSRSSLKEVNNKLSALREKIEICDSEHNKTISNLKKIHFQEITKLKESISELTEENKELKLMPWQAEKNEPTYYGE